MSSNEEKRIRKKQLQDKYNELGYWVNYYQQKTKVNKYYCLCCDHEVDRSHKARHFKTQKHLNNERIFNFNNSCIIPQLSGDPHPSHQQL